MTKPLIGLTCRWDEENQRDYLPSEYAEAVAAAGGAPVLIPLIPDVAAELASRLEAIVLTGSASDVDPARYGRERAAEVTKVHPQRDAADFAVLEQAFRDKKPVLGICFGMQSLNVYRGGTLIQHIPGNVPNAVEHNREARHDVRLETASFLASLAGSTPSVNVNSWHHQSVEKPGAGLRVAAVAPDGVIEAVEGTESDHFVIAVQWHPERIWKDEPLSARLFQELVKAVASRRQRRSKYTDLVRHSTELSRNGRTGEAITLLETELANPDLQQDHTALQLLSGHASVMCRYKREYGRGVRILEQALRILGERPRILYSLGEMSLQLEESARARDYFRRCHDACIAENNQDYLQLLETKAGYWK